MICQDRHRLGKEASPEVTSHCCVSQRVPADCYRQQSRAPSRARCGFSLVACGNEPELWYYQLERNESWHGRGSVGSQGNSYVLMFTAWPGRVQRPTSDQRSRCLMGCDASSNIRLDMVAFLSSPSTLGRLVSSPERPTATPFRSASRPRRTPTPFRSSICLCFFSRHLQQ